MTLCPCEKHRKNDNNMYITPYIYTYAQGDPPNIMFNPFVHGHITMLRDNKSSNFWIYLILLYIK